MNGLNGLLQADKLVQERYEKLVLGLRALEVANEKQEKTEREFAHWLKRVADLFFVDVNFKQMVNPCKRGQRSVLWYKVFFGRKQDWCPLCIQTLFF